MPLYAGARPPESFRFLAGHLRQRFSWDLGPHWGVAESLGGEGFTPLDARDLARPASVAGDGTFAVYRRWLRDRASVRARAGLAYSEAAVRDARIVRPEGRATFVEGTLGMVHDFSSLLTGEANAGVTSVRWPGRSDSLQAFAGSASLRHGTRGMKEAAIEVDRGTYANVLLGDVFLTTRAAVRGARPFGRWSWLLIAGAIDYSHAESRLSGGAGQVIGMLTARMVLDYDPGRLARYGLHYVVSDQRTLRSDGILDTGGYRRHLLLLMVEARYPAAWRRPD
jgi:hypothetical protein